MFSKACEYGIRAVIFLTSRSKNGECITITEISLEIDSPTAFTAKILQKLVKKNIITSVKGPHGGFYISDELTKQTKLRDIVEIIDGDTIYNGCGLGLKECDELNPCPLHDKFKLLRDDLNVMLIETSIKDLAVQLDNGAAVLKST